MTVAFRALLVLILFMGFISDLQGQEITDTLYLDRPHFRIKTANATYLYDRAGGGFSSILDKYNTEWVGFRPGEGKVPGSAAADFRGIPNLVFRGSDNGAGHPGFEQCISHISAPRQITTTSISGIWKWRWSFREDYVQLELLQIDTARSYWFLYEGIPGGAFDPSKQFWGNNLDGLRKDAPPIGSDKTANGFWNWAFFGHQDYPALLYIVHLTPDGQNDTFSYMGASREGIDSAEGMVVFGFGRKGATPLLQGKHSFLFGFYELPEKNSDFYSTLEQHIMKTTKLTPQKP
jgi:hypothetical protein